MEKVVVEVDTAGDFRPALARLLRECLDTRVSLDNTSTIASLLADLSYRWYMKHRVDSRANG